MKSLPAFSVAIAACSIWIMSCAGLPSATPPPATVWLFPAPDEQRGGGTESVASGLESFVGPLITVDSVTFGPSVAIPASAVTAGASKVALVSTYQGSRYHPESIRGLADDSVAAAGFAGSLGRLAASNANGLFIDFQGATPDELVRTTRILRSIADSARALNLSPIGIVVPPGDTIGYPTAILARTADLIVVRLSGEHRPGTSPGPLASPEWITRQIGMRAYAIGVNRLVAELPLFGYLWERNGSVRRISFDDAQSLVQREAGVFRRDPASGSLSASSIRDGWTIWIGDASTLERLIGVARRMGVRRFALLGTNGADPSVWTRLPYALAR